LFGKLTDKELIEGIRLQDEKVLKYLYDHYFLSVRNHVAKNSGTPEDVSDVFQDTIIIIYRQISDNTLTLTSDLKGYFFGIARNVWNSQLRHKTRVSELNIDIVEESEAEDIYDSTLEKILNRAFQKLTPDNQTILRLFYEGISYEEIAIRMNLKNEAYARRKKYLSKEALVELIKRDPEFREYHRFLK
jgi:RNA polymerase sigma factor (sigma-70 family)